MPRGARAAGCAGAWRGMYSSCVCGTRGGSNGCAGSDGSVRAERDHSGLHMRFSQHRAIGWSGRRGMRRSSWWWGGAFEELYEQHSCAIDGRERERIPRRCTLCDDAECAASVRTSQGSCRQPAAADTGRMRARRGCTARKHAGLFVQIKLVQISFLRLLPEGLLDIDWIRARAGGPGCVAQVPASGS